MNEPWVVFSIANQRYCSDTSQIKEVITYRPANPIPGAPEGVEGIITVRQDKITLFSGAELVAGETSGAANSGHIILLESDADLFGVTVDGVEGIIEVNLEQIDPSSVSQDNAVLGTLPHGGAMLTAVSLVTFCENAIAAQGL